MKIQLFDSHLEVVLIITITILVVDQEVILIIEIILIVEVVLTIEIITPIGDIIITDSMNIVCSLICCPHELSGEILL